MLKTNIPDSLDDYTPLTKLPDGAVYEYYAEQYSGYLTGNIYLNTEKLFILQSVKSRLMNRTAHPLLTRLAYDEIDVRIIFFLGSRSCQGFHFQEDEVLYIAVDISFRFERPEQLIAVAVAETVKLLRRWNNPGGVFRNSIDGILESGHSAYYQESYLDRVDIFAMDDDLYQSFCSDISMGDEKGLWEKYQTPFIEEYPMVSCLSVLAANYLYRENLLDRSFET